MVHVKLCVRIVCMYILYSKLARFGPLPSGFYAELKAWPKEGVGRLPITNRFKRFRMILYNFNFKYELLMH